MGSQAQVLAAYGGFNQVAFLRNGTFSVKPMTIPPKRVRELNARPMLFYTGIKRTASDIASSFLDKIHEKKRHLLTLRSLVDEALFPWHVLQRV